MTTRIYHQKPPSEDALENITSLHIDRFQGEQSSFFREILIREIDLLPHFDYLEDYPSGLDGQVAIIDAEVMVRSISEEEVNRNQKEYRLIKHQVPQDNQPELAQAAQTFEFQEIPLNEHWFQRTMDLKVHFSFRSAKTNEVLKETIEQIGFQQIYGENEELLPIPDSEVQMTRLARTLMQRLLLKISPSVQQEIHELETGSAPWSWTGNTIDPGHPWIVKGIRFASKGEFEKSLKIWNYVIFEPKGLSARDKHIFNEQAFARLKQVGLPDPVLKQMLKLYGRKLASKELMIVLGRLLNLEDRIKYEGMIRTQTRDYLEDESVNLAAAHYNLGIVHKMRGELQMATYHFAQANARLTRDKYAQKWADTEIEMGTYNPVAGLTGKTILKAGTLKPPEMAMVRPQTEPVISYEDLDITPRDKKTTVIKPVELPMISSQIQPQNVSSKNSAESGYQNSNQ